MIWGNNLWKVYYMYKNVYFRDRMCFVWFKWLYAWIIVYIDIDVDFRDWSSFI